MPSITDGTVGLLAAWLGPLLVAPFIGSFLGVLITRLPEGRPVAVARSCCAHCGTPLGWPDLVPLLSYAVLRGRCRHCGGAIGVFHPAVEIAACLVAWWAIAADPGAELTWASCALGWTLLTLAWIDWISLWLPDLLTLPLLLAGLAVTWLTQPEALTDHAAAACLAYLSFQGLALAYRSLRGREGLGGGDSKLIAAAGAWCGLSALPIIVLGSATLGLLTALGLMLRSAEFSARATYIPFGPCIAAAFWLAWLYPGWVNALLTAFGGV